jgi:hypothetical protein
MKKSGLLLGLALGLLSIGGARASATDVQIAIDSPREGAEVHREEVVTGHVSDPKLNVYVLVRPERADLWWVQPPPAPPSQKGNWKTKCYFGKGTVGVGENFEIIAIATEEKHEADEQLPDLPVHVAHSDTVTVHRSPAVKQGHP